MNKDNALKLFHNLYGKDLFMSSPFGYRSAVYDGKGKLVVSAGYHDGVDYSVQGNSKPIYAIEDGVVLQEGMDSSGGIFCYVHYPRLGYVGFYYHLNNTIVSKGDKVTKDTKLGMMGRTGKYVSGIHLHFGWFKFTDYSKAYSKRKYEDYNTYVFPIDYVGTPIARNDIVDQIEVKVDMLNARNKSNGDRIAFAKKGIYNILSKEVNGEYTWYQIEPNMWIAYNEAWETLLPRKISELEILKKQVENLNKQLEYSNKQVDILATECRKYKEALDEINRISNI